MGCGAVILVLVWSASGLLADGFRNPPESASALGRCGGKLVLVDDASAATVNPANLTDLTSPVSMVSMTGGYAVREYDSPTGIGEETENPWAYLPGLFAAWPLAQDGLAAGLGVTVPFGRSTDWGDDVSFGAFSPYYAEQFVLSVNPTLAMKIGPNVSVAAGVSFYQSSLTFKQVFPWSQLTGDATSLAGDAEFDGDGESYGGNAAVTWRINDRHALALTYRSPFDVEYDGDFTVSNVPETASAMGLTSTTDFETEVKYPTVVQAGYGIKLTDKVRIEFDVEWIEHSRNDYLPIDIGPYSVVLNLTEIPQDWNDNWTYGVGMDWRFAPNWVARTGYIYLETPTTTATTIPVASEESQSVVSVGLGHERGRHRFDIAYAIGLFDGLTVDDNVVPAVNGDYDFESHLVSMAYQCGF